MLPVDPDPDTPTGIKQWRLTDPVGIMTFALLARQHFRGNVCYFRGQRQDWPLRPTLFRDQRSEHVEDDVCVWERTLVNEFMLRAPAYYDNVPDNSDFAKWLVLMRHHGMPSRLLDWTASIFAASYFALGDPPYSNDDAVVWALCPGAMNRDCNHYCGVFNLDGGSSLVSRIRDIPFNKGIEHVPPMFVIAPRLSGRPLLQQSEYTLHATNDALESECHAHTWLCRLRIDTEMKAQLRETLEVCGFVEHVAVSDLDSLAGTLIARQRMSGSE